ncbi:MAG: tetratricopeptide repeat protein [Planctomycetes bacterium]|nr:tetratricopeptide repeat protein [Planctomycetota bacterium]
MRDNRFSDPASNDGTGTVEVPRPAGHQVVQVLQRYHQGQQHLRRGICLLNAGRYDQAAHEFRSAARANPESRSLPRLLAACHLGAGQADRAAEQFDAELGHGSSDIPTLVRLALLTWKDGRPLEAILSLRQALADHPESAELHFQIGTLLAAQDELEEAELRFTQAIAIEKNHTQALVALAQCHAVAGRVAEARGQLERAQRRRPHDARIGLLLAQAAQAMADQGLTVSIRAEMCDDRALANEPAIEQLSLIVEAEPEFIDAFCTLPAEDRNEEVYAALAEALNRALERSPQKADLHCAQGRILEQLGQPEQAVVATERALDLNPRLIRALVQLARLYQQTDRIDDAVERLERVIQLGVRYADVYYLMGNLYRSRGESDRARQAYVAALEINDRYEAARTALGTLAA